MNDDNDDRSRVTWMTRINIRPPARDALRALAKAEHISAATMIGMMIEDHITARSSA